MTGKAPYRINKSLTILDRNIMTFATKKGSQRYSKQKNMLTPELNISANFTTADRISSETLWAYCAELKKTKAVIFALCIRGRVDHPYVLHHQRTPLAPIVPENFRHLRPDFRAFDTHP